MVGRSYKQFCGFSAALDLLGERWTLLVIRELLPGGRRFNDLFESLPGVSTNLLTSRLRTLESAGIVHRHQLKHPAPVQLYELTDWGEALRPIINQLGLWGVRLLPDPTNTDHRIEPRWLLGAITMAYQGGLPDGHIAFTIDDADLTITISGDIARLSYGAPPEPPIASLQLNSEEFSTLALSRGTSIEHLKVTGSPTIVATLFANLPALPTD